MAHIFTVYAKTPEDGRGEYSEELDVRVPRRSVALALKKAQAELDRDYVPGMRAARAKWRGETVPGVTTLY